MTIGVPTLPVNEDSMSEYADFIQDIFDNHKDVRVEVGAGFYLGKIDSLVGDYVTVDVNYNGNSMKLHSHVLSLRCVQFPGD